MKQFVTKPLAILLGILFISLLPRLYLLHLIPTTLVHDEIFYVGLAQSLAATGTDLTGTWNAWSLTPAHHLYAELPAVLMAPAAYVISDPLLAARASQAVFGALFPLVLGYLSWILFKKYRIAAVTFVITAFNPWVFQFSRMSFDALYSLFFYYLGIALLIRLNGWKKLLCLAPLIIGFFQYQGLKIIFLPMVLFTLLYVLLTQYSPQLTDIISKKKWVSLPVLIAPLLVIGLVSFAVLGTYIIRLRSQSAAVRVSDIIFFDTDYLAQQVNDNRRLSLQNPLQEVFTNKVVVLFHQIFIKYTSTINLSHLFAYGENVRNPYSVWYFGIFYPLDILFIIFGLKALWQRKEWRATAWFLLGLMLLAPIPSAINTVDTWIMFRASFLVPLLIILIALGFDELWSLASIKNVKVSYFSRSLLIVLYLLNIAWFSYDYFFRYPLYSTKGNAFAERVLSSYAARVKNQQIKVLTNDTTFVFYNFLVFNRLITAENMPEIRSALQNQSFQFKHISFQTDCFDPTQLDPNTVVINEAINPECDESQKAGPILGATTPSRALNIPSLLDSGSIFRIYNDQVCKDYNVPGFSRVTKLGDFDVERLSDREFCEKLLVITNDTSNQEASIETSN